MNPMNKADKIVKIIKIRENEEKLVKEYSKQMWGRKDDDKWLTTQEIKSDKQMPTT